MLFRSTLLDISIPTGVLLPGAFGQPGNVPTTVRAYLSGTIPLRIGVAVSEAGAPVLRMYFDERSDLRLEVVALSTPGSHAGVANLFESGVNIALPRRMVAMLPDIPLPTFNAEAWVGDNAERDEGAVPTVANSGDAPVWNFEDAELDIYEDTIRLGFRLETDS